MKFKPFDYQHGMVDHLRDTPHAALFAGMVSTLHGILTKQRRL
jgi:hypothetical protein